MPLNYKTVDFVIGYGFRVERETALEHVNNRNFINLPGVLVCDMTSFYDRMISTSTEPSTEAENAELEAIFKSISAPDSDPEESTFVFAKMTTFRQFAIDFDIYTPRNYVPAELEALIDNQELNGHKFAWLMIITPGL